MGKQLTSTFVRYPKNLLYRKFLSLSLFSSDFEIEKLGF